MDSLIPDGLTSGAPPQKIRRVPTAFPPDQTRPSAERMQVEAALWFARMRGGRATDDLRDRFNLWLAADAAHRREYEILEQIWDKSGQLVPQARGKPDLGRARLLRGAASLAGAAVLCVWLGMAWFGGRISTDVGERQHIQLAGGSELDIAPRTRLRVRFDGTRRRLELEEGRIVVSVAADPRRPFEVHAGGGVIRDIGTRFEVQADRVGRGWSSPRGSWRLAFRHGATALSIASMRARRPSSTALGCRGRGRRIPPPRWPGRRAS